MDLLTPFRERIWHFFAPEKTATPTITKPTSPRTAPPLNADDTTAKPQARRLSLSPTVKRVKEKADEEYALSFDDKNEDESGDEEHSELSEEASDVEDEDTQEPKPKRLKRSKDYTADNSDFEPDDEEEETQADITQDEKDEFGIGITIEPVEHATLGDPEYEGWTQDELDLYNKLNDRGVVPLLHSSWKIDFPTIPEVLFTDDKEEAYIKAELGTEFRGSKALSILLQSGVRIRDRSTFSRQNPAPILARIIKSYITWSLKDVGFDQRQIIPLVSVMAAPRTEAIQKTVTRMTVELQNLAARWRDAWADETSTYAHSPRLHNRSDVVGTKRKRDPESQSSDSNGMHSLAENAPLPTLYGVVIARTIMAFVTYDAALIESNVRNLALFNWRDQGQDVWNTLAVALMVVQAREVLVWMDENGKLRRRMSWRDIEDDDPDL